MEEVHHGFNSSAGLTAEDNRFSLPLSPTAFPGANNIPPLPTATVVKAGPMFPDMRRDEFMSKSTISTKETALGGDYWSVSSASESQLQYNNNNNNNNSSYRGNYESAGSGRRQSYDRDIREYDNNRDYDSRGRRDTSLERRPRPLPVDHQRRDMRPHSKGRPRERLDIDEQETLPPPSSRTSQYDDDYNSERYDSRYRRKPPAQFEDDYRGRAQPSLRAEDDGYAAPSARAPPLTRNQYARSDDDDDDDDDVVYAATVAVSSRTPRGLPQHLHDDDDDYGAPPPSRTPRSLPQQQQQHFHEDDEYAAPRGPQRGVPHDHFEHDRDAVRTYHDQRRERERFAARSPRGGRNMRSEEDVLEDPDYRRRPQSPQRAEYGADGDPDYRRRPKSPQRAEYGAEGDSEYRRRPKSPQRSEYGAEGELDHRRRPKSPQRSDYGGSAGEMDYRRRPKSPQRSDFGPGDAIVEIDSRRRARSPQRSDYGGADDVIGEQHDYGRRAKSPQRPSDYGYATDEHDEYERLSSRGDRQGRSKSRDPRRAVPSRLSGERGRPLLETNAGGWEEEIPHRRRSPSRGRPASRERPRGVPREYDPYEPAAVSIPKTREHPRSTSSSRYVDDYSREKTRPRPRSSRDYDQDDDASDVPYQFEVMESKRGRQRKSRYDDDDESSASSLLVERGAPKQIDVHFSDVDERDHGRGRSRSIEKISQRRRSKSREKPRAPSEFVIDISQPTFETEDVDRGGVRFSPSTEIPRAASDAGSSRMSDDYSQRIADANLMKEQSEARHQILKEVRQAMEMRDIATTTEDRLFWGRQVSTLNTSLKRLWENSEPSSEITPRSDMGRSVASQSPAASAPTPSSVNNYTTVKVQAPDNLPAGHQFTIRVNGKPLKAQVPGGGVRKGDLFTIRIPLNGQPTTPARPSSTTSMVKVRAPASLPEGYRFTAKMGDRTIVATVPPGGVQKGEIFAVPVSDA